MTVLAKQLHHESGPWTGELGKSLYICYHLEKIFSWTLTNIWGGFFFACLLLRHKFWIKFSLSAVSLSLQLNS